MSLSRSYRSTSSEFEGRTAALSSSVDPFNTGEVPVRSGTMRSSAAAVAIMDMAIGRSYRSRPMAFQSDGPSFIVPDRNTPLERERQPKSLRNMKPCIWHAIRDSDGVRSSHRPMMWGGRRAAQ